MKVEMFGTQKSAMLFLFSNFDFFVNLQGRFGRFTNLPLSCKSNNRKVDFEGSPWTFGTDLIIDGLRYNRQEYFSIFCFSIIQGVAAIVLFLCLNIFHVWGMILQWAPCRNQTPSGYNWKIVESDVKPEQTNNNIFPEENFHTNNISWNTSKSYLDPLG